LTDYSAEKYKDSVETSPNNKTANINKKIIMTPYHKTEIRELNALAVNLNKCILMHAV